MIPHDTASHLGLFSLRRGISSKIGLKIQSTPDALKNYSGLIQILMIGKSIRHGLKRSSILVFICFPFPVNGSSRPGSSQYENATSCQAGDRHNCNGGAKLWKTGICVMYG